MAAPGLYGKLASHGDFVTRRLPPPFVAAWDGWLQECMQASRMALGDAWLDAYLTAPVWRFALAPGALPVDAPGSTLSGDPDKANSIGCAAERTLTRPTGHDSVRTSAQPAAWAGVLMPSVDRVGRHFPLTLAACGDGALPLAGLLGAAGWYGALESLALSTLAPRFSFDDFDAALQQMAGAPVAASAARQDAHGWLWDLDDADAAAAVAGQVASAALHGHSLWWTDGSERVAPCLRLFRGLPSAQAFATMLDG